MNTSNKYGTNNFVFLVDEILEKNYSYLVCMDTDTEPSQINNIRIIHNFDNDKEAIFTHINSLSDFDDYLIKRYGSKYILNYLVDVYPSFNEFYLIVKTCEEFNIFDHYNIIIIRLLDKENNIVNSKYKYYHSDNNYNYAFNTNDGKFIRFSNKYNIDPKISKLGPEIADIEISTLCNNRCPFCYKGNNKNGKNMSVQLYKKIINTLNQNNTLTQVALGVGTVESIDIEDFKDILSYTRSLCIVPNITIPSYKIDKEYMDAIAKYCGAISISNYDIRYTIELVKEFDNYRKIDTNKLYNICIHQRLCKETIKEINDLITHLILNPDEAKLINSIIFLTHKNTDSTKVPAHKITMNEFKDIIQRLRQYNICYGFDSCGCYNFLNAVKNDINYNSYYSMVDSCESTLFSIYVNVEGKVFPCSFVEKCNDLNDINSKLPQITIDKNYDLLMDIWYESNINLLRKKLYNSYDDNLKCYKCPYFDINYEEDSKKKK